MQSKIIALNDLTPILKAAKKRGETIVHCHGVFDLLHPGHIRHFKEAKKQGDLLIITVTSDRHVNKGPGRPVFPEALRMETLATIDYIDYVVLSDFSDATPCIKSIQPNLYVKGKEYANHSSDITGKIAKEAQAVQAISGKIYYTDDIVFSSSSLLNAYFDTSTPELKQFLSLIKKTYTLQDLIDKIDSFSELRVLIIGDAIIDEYQYVNILGQSGKGHHMTAECLNRETFLGGSLIIANHIAQFSNHITLLTAIGKKCPYQTFIHQMLNSKIKPAFIELKDHMTLTKKRYVMKDGRRLSKLFETYSTKNISLNNTQIEQEAIHFFEKESQNYDLILVCDFGNGFTSPAIIKAISKLPNFLAVNTQLNSGNRGFNVVTHYNRADFISLNEPELRLSAHDRHTSLETIAATIATKLKCQNMCITRGVKGVFCTSKENAFHIPALATQTIDRVGAGDSFLALSAMAAAKSLPLPLIGFFGSIASAMDVQIVGNKEAIQKTSYQKFLTRLMK